MDLLSVATGFFLGVRHCFEPDHLTAVAHFASAAGRPRDGLRSGVLWGLGHGAAVLAIGIALAALPPRAYSDGPMAERAVGATLIALSLWRLRSLWRRAHVHVHGHEGGVVHVHPHVHERSHRHFHAPTLTGLVHGTAGAIGIVAMLAVARTPLSMGLMALSFATGAVVAMGAAGWVAGRLYASAAAAGWERPAVAFTAALGLALGVFWILRA